MESELVLADAVVVVCTPEYARRANERRGGVGYEGQILSTHIFSAQRSLTCIPVVARGTTSPGPECAIPSMLSGRYALDFTSIERLERNFPLLESAIRDRPAVVSRAPHLSDDSTREPAHWGRWGGARASIPRDYDAPFALEFDQIAEALDAIQTLSQPATCRDLRRTHSDPWILSVTETTISTVYSLWAPVIGYQLQREDLQRRRASFDWRTKLQLCMLESLTDCFTNDALIANIDPKIEYSPRVSGWRRLREHHPSRYWWQGVSPERLADIISHFALIDRRTGLLRLRSRVEFRDHFHQVVQSADPADRWPIGIAANPLFGFEP
jgi:hypothetical protein